MPPKVNKIKNVLPKLTSDMSSGTVSDGILVKNTDVFSKLQNTLKTRTVLNQSEGIYQGFNRKTFGIQAIDVYNRSFIAYNANNKVDLMKQVSFPLYNALLDGKNDPKIVLPFKFYKPISASQEMARIFSHDDYAFNKYFTWHQMSMKFQMEDKETGEIVEKINVFERREVDATDGFWRLMHLEN